MARCAYNRSVRAPNDTKNETMLTNFRERIGLGDGSSFQHSSFPSYDLVIWYDSSVQLELGQFPWRIFPSPPFLFEHSFVFARSDMLGVGTPITEFHLVQLCTFAS